MATTLTLPAFRVTLPDQDAFEVHTTNADLVRWDMTSAKHKWPTYKDAPFLWTTFLAWCAARRAKLTELSWEAWSDAVVQVESIGDGDTAVPTGPDLVSG